MLQKCFLLSTVFLLYISLSSLAVGTFEEVYTDVFVPQCMTCHSDDWGNSMETVRQTLIDELPSNNSLIAKRHQLVFEGDPYRSTLFRYINNGLAPDIESLPIEDKDGTHSSIQLSDYHKELIRQWILYGAPDSQEEVVDHELIQEFYNGNGVYGVPHDQIPEKPAPSEGFQIHYGPFFLPPWEGIDQPNVEFYSKYYTYLDEDTEIHRLDAQLGSSHHLILYRFNSESTADRLREGLRPNAYHNDVSYVTGYQNSYDLRLPEGTAFTWQKNSILDINGHSINYSQTAVLATDMYVNVYTQKKGTAKQEMFSDLIPNVGIYIPNDGQEHIFESEFTYGVPTTLHVWGVSSHTHKYGTDFDVWLRNPDGSKGEHIFDGSKYNGIPTCEEIGYDFQHPPVRYFNPFLPVKISDGIIQRAKYVNNGPESVRWGETSNDEMMITGVFYTLSTSGITPNPASQCFADEITSTAGEIIANPTLQAHISPNPFSEQTTLSLTSPETDELTIEIYNLQGQLVKNLGQISVNAQSNQQISIDAEGLNTGMYFYHIRGSEGGSVFVGKMMVD